MPNADVILQSSDLVHFRVHRSVLVASALQASGGTSLGGCGGSEQPYFDIVPRTSRNAPL
ncbi:hypothetical protein BJV77DRAFT_1029225 [Russula vinacea]|nr:hypothetical protein BJV77DRAFT_1029225 [Russula vinacea]